MIYKSYILEQNVNSINEKITLFYGVNLGLKNDLKAKIIESHKNSEILRYSQDEILKDEKAIIQDLITAAHNNAKSQLKSKTSEELSKATGGFGIPGFKWPL